MSNTTSKEEYNQFHALCPQCYTQTLNGIVTVDYCKVPLRDDGYDTNRGDAEQSQVVHVQCPDCGWEGEGGYYYRGGEALAEEEKTPKRRGGTMTQFTPPVIQCPACKQTEDHTDDCKLIEHAREEYQTDEVEIDINARLSPNSEGGYWVQAWVYLFPEDYGTWNTQEGQ